VRSIKLALCQVLTSRKYIVLYRRLSYRTNVLLSITVKEGRTSVNISQSYEQISMRIYSNRIELCC